MTRCRTLLLPLVAALACVAQDARSTPEAMYQWAVSNPDPAKGFGESFCWYSNLGVGPFLSRFAATGDTAWLDGAVRYYDYLLGKMQTGPDGYKGWIGPYIYDENYWCDVHVGDSILLDGMLEFAELVLKNAALEKRYGEAARRYVAVAERDVIEKWDARGTWYEDGPIGGYISWNRYCLPGDLKNWPVRNDVIKSNLSLPFNKQEDMGAVALRLYRIIGREKYRAKAEKIFAFAKSRMQLIEDYYVWNYWEPLWPGDVDVAAGQTRHWIGVHPYRNYQSGEVSKIVHAYHTGVVFDRLDIKRIVNTNLKVMWNGDRANPRFRNSNSTLPFAPGAAPEKNTAGALWTALLPFNQTLRDIYAASRGRGERRLALDQPPDFRRRYVTREPESLPQFPLHHCPEVNFAAALPSVIRAGKETLLMANRVAPGDLEIALYSADGCRLERVLNRERRTGLVIFRWNGDDPAGKKRFRGPYRVRWTAAEGSWREALVTIED